MLSKKIVATLFTDWFRTKYPDEFNKYFGQFENEVEEELQ